MMKRALLTVLLVQCVFLAPWIYATSRGTAKSVLFDNAGTGLAATTVHDALVEINAAKDSSSPLTELLGQRLESLIGVGVGSLAIVFDDFNAYIQDSYTDGTLVGDLSANTEGPIWDQLGWRLTDVGSPSSLTAWIGMNQRQSGQSFKSSLQLFGGNTNAQGISAQLDRYYYIHQHGGDYFFPFVYIPDDDTCCASIADNRVYVFGARIGFRDDVPSDGADCSGDWESAAYVGWAQSQDTDILDTSDGSIAQTEDGPLLGFHATEAGELRGISQRTPGTTYAAGTNYISMLAAGGIDGTTANGALYTGGTLWVDAIAVVTYADRSASTGNGTTCFWVRKIVPGNAAQGDFTSNGCLTDVTPEPTDPDDLVPTLEVLNGPTAGCDPGIFLDWWVMAQSRFSLTSGMR